MAILKHASLQPHHFPADVCIVGGAGHVGLPLALTMADAGLQTIIYDINSAALRSISAGVVPFMEHGATRLLESCLAQRMLTLSDDPAAVSNAAAVVLTIGTPVDGYHNPMQRLVKECADALLPYLSDGQLIVLRSTVFPGTTDWLHNYFAEQGLQPQLAYCPERIAQGKAIEEIGLLPQIVSGTSPEAVARASDLFGLIAPEVIRLQPIEAELAKLFANAYRYIQFAAANQFHLIAQSAGADYSHVLAALKHNYPRAKDLPGAGFVAGPCLFKDTMQLAAYARNQFTLGQAAADVNEGLVWHVVEQISRNNELEHCTVGLLGMAFKADCDDTRGSLSYKLKNALAFRCKKVLTTDPFVQTDQELLPIEEVIERSDILILCAPHSIYRELDFGGTPVLDIWGHLRPKVIDGTLPSLKVAA